MSTAVAQHAAASVATFSSILARRGVLTRTLRSQAFSSRSERACSSRRATTSSIRLRSASMVAVIGRGMVQRGALLAGSTPWQSTRSLPSRGRGLHGRALASGSDPAAAPQHRCVGRLAVCSSRVLRHLRVPGGSYRESRRMGAARRDGARTTGVVRPLAPFLAGCQWQFSACRLQRCVSRERLHDRRSADDRRRSFQQRHLDLLPVSGPLRNRRLPDLPASDGDAAAEAGTPACLRPGSDGPRSDPGPLRSPSSSSCTWMRARSRS